MGDEDVRCIETNLMLKSTLPNAGLWICPNTGHAINLEEPFAFNAQVESFLSAVERGYWRRGFPGTEVASHSDGVDTHVETIRPSKPITNQPRQTWSVCIAVDGLEFIQERPS